MNIDKATRKDFDHMFIIFANKLLIRRIMSCDRVLSNDSYSITHSTVCTF